MTCGSDFRELRLMSVFANPFRVESAPVDMQINQAGVERVLRVAIGLAVISLVFVGPRTPWGWLGLSLVATGLVGFCPMHRLFGINTCRVARRDHAQSSRLVG